MIDTIVGTLLDQVKERIKTAAQKRELRKELRRILSEAEHELYYNDISKLIETGSLTKQLITYCQNVTISGDSIDKRCSDIVNACRIETAYRSQVRGVIFRIALCFFNIINNPKDSDLWGVINTILQSNFKDFEEIRALLLKLLAELEKNNTSQRSTLPIQKSINIPFPQNRYFSNREDILTALHDGFAGGQRIQYLSGMGGVGKTQIALEYAYRHQAEYEHILWVNTETEATVMDSYRIFVRQLKLLEQKEETPKDEQILDCVLCWMETSSQFLVVYDNVADIPNHCDWWPKNCGGHILITTQKKNLPLGKRFSITNFSMEEAIAFLAKRTEQSETEAMETLSKRLGRLPLALEQAAAFIANDDKIDFQGYLKLLASHGLSVMDDTEGVIDYDRSVTATLEIAMERIGLESARQLLNLCSYLAPDHIDPSLFHDAAELLPEPLQKKLSDALSSHKVWRELSRYSLLQTQEGEDGYSIHRLLQEVIRRQIGDDQQWAQCCLKIFINEFDFEYGNVDSHQIFIQLLPHVEAFLSHVEATMVDKGEQKKIADLYHEGGWGHQHLGNYPQALIWYNKALVIVEKALGKDHPDTATTYNNIAGVYQSQGEYPKALEWYNKALAIRETVLSKDHPSTAATYNNIASVYNSQSEYLKALEWYNKALVIRETVLGKNHPDTATTYNNIASVYKSQGEYPMALEWYNKALVIVEKVLGKDHPFTATTYNNIAVVYASQSNYPKALEWFNKALVIKEKVLGIDHPDTALTYNNIASVYQSQGEYPKALEWFNKALAIRETVLGKNHPDSAPSYNNIALVYKSQGDYPKALEWYNKALAIVEKVLGKNHPSTATTYNNIAGVYDSQGDYPKALEWFNKALVIRETVLGKNHPDTATTYNNIAGVYYSQGDYPKALEWYMKDLAISETVLGKDHPDTAATYNNIAGVYQSQGEYPKALEWYIKALVIKEKVLGKNHPFTAYTYNNIAMVYQAQGENKAALEWFQNAFDILMPKLGENHPNTQIVAENMRYLQSFLP